MCKYNGNNDIMVFVDCFFPVTFLLYTVKKKTDRKKKYLHTHAQKYTKGRDTPTDTHELQKYLLYSVAV